MQRIRTFVALNLPVAAINKVAELQKSIVKQAEQDEVRVGWVPPANMHLTLKFIGEIAEENVPAVRDLLSARLAERPAISLSLAGVGVFPDFDTPRVIWVGVRAEDEAVRQLASDVDSWLAELGYAEEKRSFHPHLTLGRIKQLDGAAVPQSFIEALKEKEELSLDAYVADEVVFYRSQLQRSGAEYLPLERVRLRPGRKPTTT
jgi:RNA 2',3'-cyclic 3'-phosphodiesterase